MQTSFTPEAWEDYLYWQKLDKKMLHRVNELIKDAMHEPFSGKGKPESLKFELQGYWSRRLDQEHRLVYKILDNSLVIIAARFHHNRFNSKN